MMQISSNINHWDNISPLFIAGIARSGTTLLQSLLDGHPELIVDAADSRFIRWYRHYYRWLDAFSSHRDPFETRLELAEKYLISHIFNEDSHYYQDFLSHVPIDKLKADYRHFVTSSPRRAQDYLESYFKALSLASGMLSEKTRYWVDKTLSYEYLLFRYLEWWPHARFIFMTRDPRDVYASYKKRDLKNNRRVTPVVTFAEVWGNSVRAYRQLEQLLPGDQYFRLQYEELINDQEGTMRKIAGFLGIEFRPGLLEPTKGFGRVPWGGNPESGQKHHGIYRTAMDKWKTVLTERDVHQIEALLSDELNFAGYSQALPQKPEPAAKMLLLLRRTMFKVLNYKM